MTRVAVATALIFTCACAGRSQDRIQDTFAAVEQAFRRGELADAETLADQGLGLMRGEPDSQRAWKFRLLRAEIEIARNNFSEALPFLSAPLPGGPQFDSLRARHIERAGRIHEVDLCVDVEEDGSHRETGTV